MTERNRSAVYIRVRTIQSQLLFDSQILSSKSFIDFYQIDVRELEPRLVQSLARSRHWSNSHYLRLNARIVPANNATHRLRVFSLQIVRSANDQRGGAIDDS